MLLALEMALSLAEALMGEDGWIKFEMEMEGPGDEDLAREGSLKVDGIVIDDIGIEMERGLERS